MAENWEYKRAWLQYYLQTHPVVGIEPVTEEVLEKWVVATSKATYVSIYITFYNFNRYKSKMANLAFMSRKII